MKAFAETDPGFPAGAAIPDRPAPDPELPVGRLFGGARPQVHLHDHRPEGSPANLIPHAATKIVITTESPEGGTHDVYFNRGVAASQEYVRRFGDKKPEEVANNQAFIWLSRGLYEAMVAFVESAEPGKHALRIAAYEFRYEPFLQVLKDAIDRGVDISIIYDARKEKPRDDNREAVGQHRPGGRLHRAHRQRLRASRTTSSS